jgi:hypothetical protein
MEKLQLICFKLHPTVNPFRMNKVYNFFEQPAFPVNWLSIDSLELSVSLNNQVKNNYIEFMAMTLSCEDDEYDKPFSVVTIENQVYINYFDSTLQQKEENCKLFKQREKDYLEVISRDQDALTYDHVKVQLYAHVLVYNNIYQGHIYSWLSPYNTDYCFAMGIRNRIDSIFTRHLENNLKNISHYLLEGVRRFAISKGANHFIITYPKPIMIKILPTLGFERLSISNKLIGQSISPGSFGNCNNCYKLIDVIKPITDYEMTFLLIE